MQNSHTYLFNDVDTTSALEIDFPIDKISQIAEKESWRKEIYRPIYHIHKWWATRLGSVFRAVTIGSLSPSNTDIYSEFYKSHEFSDKIVLDPFMGSGTTIGESLKLGCKAIGCDINPISSFMVKQALTRIDIKALKKEFKNLENSIAKEISSYYTTIDQSTGEIIPVLYYFWTKVVTTPDGEDIPLFSSYVFSKDAYPNKKPKAQIICPKCWSVFEDLYNSKLSKCKKCSHEFNPQEGPASGQTVIDKSGHVYKIKDLVAKSKAPPKHKLYALMALNSAGEKIYQGISQYDHKLYRMASDRLESSNLPIPTMAIRPGNNTDQVRGYNYKYWKEFFNDRQLLCLGLLLKSIIGIKNESVRDHFICLFSSTLEFNNMFCSFKGEGTGAVRHMFSNHILKPERTPLENSIWGTNKSSGTFSTLFESRLLKAKEYLDKPFEIEIDSNGKSNKIISSKPINAAVVDSWQEFTKSPDAAMILNGDSSDLPLPNDVVDAVITDPPYFDFVHYSELSDFFFAWLAPLLTKKYNFFDRPNSSHEGEVQHKDPRHFAKMLGRVFKECARVLKTNGILAFSFHHSRPEGWAAIYEAVSTAGLSIVSAHLVHGELRASSPKSAASEPISLDAILVCKKHNKDNSEYNMESVVTESVEQLQSLRNVGMQLSSGDLFVIMASQVLVHCPSNKLSFSEVADTIEKTWQQARLHSS